MIYIGQASNLKERYNKHKRNIKDKNHKEDFYEALRQYGLDNFTYSVLASFEGEIDKDLLNELEIKYIKYFNSLKPNGYNMVPGGSNGAGYAKGIPVNQYDLDGNYIASYPSAIQASYATGINSSSISSCANGHISHTKQFQWKFKNDNKREIKKLEKVIIVDREIEQYDLKLNLVNTYKNLQEASAAIKIGKNVICSACSGRYKTAGGYIWKYKDCNFIKKEKKIDGHSKTVYQYDKFYNLVNVFSSTKEAQEKTGINKGNISSVCTGLRKTAGGFIWSYININNTTNKIND